MMNDTKLVTALRSTRSLLVGLFVLVLCDAVEGQRGSSRTRRYLRDSNEILTKLDPLTAVPSRSMVLVRSGPVRKAYGVAVHEDGYIVSKLSELEDELSCEFPDGRRVDADLVQLDREHDLALLRVQVDRKLPVVRWATSSVQVGQIVLIPSLQAKATSMGVVGTEPRKLEAGRPMLGVQLHQVDPRIMRIVEGTAAERIGLRSDDVIVEVNQVDIGSRQELVEALAKLRVGDSVGLVVLRAGREIGFEATLGTWEDEAQMEGDKSRVRSGFPRVFQHDCVLDPEECGGPLLDLDGRVIALNIARGGRTVNYAIPAATAKAAVEELLRSQSGATLETRRGSVK